MKSLIDRLFKTPEEINHALDDVYDVGIAMSIAKCRQQRNLTQQDLAKELGVSQSYIAQLENADVLPSHKQLKRLARVFKATLTSPKLEISPLTD